MKRILTFIFCLGFFLTLLGQNIAVAADSSKEFKAINMQGYNELIAKHKGKIIVVNFFATWCPPCREEIPGLVALAKSMSKDVVVIGLSGDENPRLIGPFVKDMNINYPVILAGMDVLRHFQVHTIPHNLVYNQDGKIVANAAGFVTEEELKKFINLLLEENVNAKRDDS